MTRPGTLRKEVYPDTTPGLFFTGKIQIWEWIMIICTKKITAMKDGRFLVGSEIVRGGAIIRMESLCDTFIIEVCNEKTEAEAVKKQEQEAKPEPVKSCGNCRHAEDIGSNTRQVVMCERTFRWSPVDFTDCPLFKPRTSEKSALGGLAAVVKSGAETAETSNKIAAKHLSGAEKEEVQDEASCRWVFRPSATLPSYVSVSDVICAFMASAPHRKPSACDASADAERIAQLEKENAELQNTNAHLRKELAWQFEQLTRKIGTLQDQNDRLREELDVATKEKDSASSRLIEQLKQMGQRIEDLEREAGERSWPPRPRFFL